MRVAYGLGLWDWPILNVFLIIGAIGLGISIFIGWFYLLKQCNVSDEETPPDEGTRRHQNATRTLEHQQNTRTPLEHHQKTRTLEHHQITTMHQCSVGVLLVF